MFNQFLVLLEQPVPVAAKKISEGGGAEIHRIPRQQPLLQFEFRKGFIATGRIAHPVRLYLPVHGVITYPQTVNLRVQGRISEPRFISFPIRGTVSRQRTTTIPVQGRITQTRTFRIPVKGRVARRMETHFKVQGTIQPNLQEQVQEARYLAERKRKRMKN